MVVPGAMDARPGVGMNPDPSHHECEAKVEISLTAAALFESGCACDAAVGGVAGVFGVRLDMLAF